MQSTPTSRSTTPDDEAARPDRRWIRRLLIGLAIPALAVAWWLGSPLFLDREVNEAFPVATEVDGTPTATSQPATEATAGAAESSSPVDAAEAPSPPDAGPEPDPEPVALVATGSFSGADDFHQGSGSATVHLVEGEALLRFEDFEVTNGPDLRVNLVLGDGSMVDLGALKGSLGNQNYDIPADVALDDIESVLIYCRAFSVPFASAEF